MKSILKRIDQANTRAELTTLLDLIEDLIYIWSDSEAEVILSACESKTRALTAH